MLPWRPMIAAVALLGVLGSALPAMGGEPLDVTFDLGARGKTITDKFSDINMWEVDRIWTEQAADQPKDYFTANYPFVRRIQLMAATGGNEQRDLFKNPLASDHPYRLRLQQTGPGLREYRRHGPQADDQNRLGAAETQRRSARQPRISHQRPPTSGL